MYHRVASKDRFAGVQRCRIVVVGFSWTLPRPRRAVCLRKRATCLQDLGISILLSSAALKIYRLSFVLAYPWTLQLSPAESSCETEQASFVNAIHVVSEMGASFGNTRFRLSTMRRFGNRRQSHARIFVAHLLNVWSRRIFVSEPLNFLSGCAQFSGRALA